MEDGSLFSFWRLLPVARLPPFPTSTLGGGCGNKGVVGWLGNFYLTRGDISHLESINGNFFFSLPHLDGEPFFLLDSTA